MLDMQGLLNITKEIDNKWVIARPENYKHRSIWEKLKDCWGVFTGKLEAIEFYKQ